MTNLVLQRMDLRTSIGFRLRKDIAWQSLEDDRTIHRVWIAEDPLSRRLFRCSDREYQLLHWLDEEASYGSVQTKFHNAFAPETLALDQIHSLLGKCVQSGLLVPVGATREIAKKWAAIWPLQTPVDANTGSRKLTVEPKPKGEAHWLLSLIQWLGVWLFKITQAQYPFGSPDRWIAPIAPRLGLFYSGASVCFWLCTLGILLGVMGMQYESLLAELPDFRSIRSPGLLVGFGVLFILTRLAHEFGHAVACKRAGASCKDAGLMVSFGMMCPYIDITDSWRIGNRFTRMGIAMAGIYTECILAVFASLVWLSTHPGWIHETALHTLLVCTVTTLLFNANPLMKYDGYFVLCDWLNTQNLRERSFEALDATLDGRSRRESIGFSIFLSCYFIASTINRLVLMFGLLAMVYFVASQLQLTGLGLGLILLYGCCWVITSMAAWTLTSSSGNGSRNQSNATAWLGWTVVSLLIAWAVNMPLPSRVHSIGAFQLGDRQPLYSGQSGRIVDVIPNPARRKLGPSDAILTLENQIIEKRMLELEAQWTRKVSQLELLEKRIAFLDERSVAWLPMIRSEIEIASNELERKREELSRLTVSVPTSGWFEPAIASLAESPLNPVDVAFGAAPSNLARFPSHWTSESSKGRSLEQGTLIGWIVKNHEARIDCNLLEEQVSGIHMDTEVRVLLLQAPREVFKGRVVELAKMGQIDSHSKKNMSPSSDVRPMTYRLRIKLNEDRDWTQYANGNAEVVFIRPSESILKMATDNWMRNSKLR